ncbi:MAG: hypothetical protein AAGB16_10795, partial [Pseudomonadota bacterium]
CMPLLLLLSSSSLYGSSKEAAAEGEHESRSFHRPALPDWLAMTAFEYNLVRAELMSWYNPQQE